MAILVETEEVPADYRQLEDAARDLVLDVMQRYGITDRDGFTCPKMRALYDALINMHGMGAY